MFKKKKKISGRPTKELKADMSKLPEEAKPNKLLVNGLFIFCVIVFIAIVVIAVLLANNVI